MTRLAAEMALKEALKRTEVERSRELLLRTETIVRDALLAPDYLSARAASRPEFLARINEYGNLTIAPSEKAGAMENSDEVFAAIARRFGSGWLGGLRATQRFLDAAEDLLDRVIATRSIRLARKRKEDDGHREAFEDAVWRHTWALIAAQIAAHHKLELSDDALASIEDDLTYTGREAYLAVCAGAHLRGEPRYCWMDMVYRCDERGDTAPALALLFDAVTVHLQEPPLFLVGLFDAIDVNRLSSRLLQGVLTATDVEPPPPGRAEFVVKAQSLLRSRYAQAASNR